MLSASVQPHDDGLISVHSREKTPRWKLTAPTLYVLTCHARAFQDLYHSFFVKHGSLLVASSNAKVWFFCAASSTLAGGAAAAGSMCAGGAAGGGVALVTGVE